MTDTERFGEELRKSGFSFFTGVPCSFLKNLINYAINDCEYVGAANEGNAVAIASGAYLGGKRPVVLMQNSGLTNASSPLVSLNYPFRIPLLGFVSLRGETGKSDEPQHELMGRITTRMLELMKVTWEYLSSDTDKAIHQLQQAILNIHHNRPFFFVVKKGTFEPVALQKQEPTPAINQIKRVKEAEDQYPPRYEALSTINSLKDGNTIQIATTGKTGRELYEIEDAENNFYMVGSMGCVSSLGLGLAVTQSRKDVVVIDGDGSLLMHMGTLATAGSYSPSNMLHILLDNQAHDSTGGQRTVSGNIDFVEIAAACGYIRVIYTHNLKQLKASIQEWKKQKGLTFIHLKIASGSKERLGRPRIKPYEVKERLRTFLGVDTTRL
ncbi:phosphonopyruvate decarboxylase [Paenibacillus larvae subsp. pulvifaciens]|uniref:Phosphonopyruvate decarboxylase n=1 Tax=Paenibacillus larvae subsp. pulvifaciens TaxID=1477 RepID=A0A1V0UYE7_9BACL|nr:phosphonopyruvate decarboxylase [Paenibacillus larvae]ARF70193.1 phosphonopyruvate decarboxylase [Paenibacillus larvae subsp. pulvifaciens]